MKNIKVLLLILIPFCAVYSVFADDQYSEKTATIELKRTNGNFNQIERFTISDQSDEIEISSVIQSDTKLGEPLELTITGKGFDKNTRVIMLPIENSNIKIFNEFDFAFDVEVVDNIAYVADGYFGLKIIDVKNPFHPIMIGAIDTPGYAYGVTVTGDTIYVADDDSGLQIIDASDLSDPKIAGTVKLNGYAQGIKVSGNIAYLANGYAGLQIMNIHNPSQLLGVADTPGWAYDIEVNGNTVYIADDDSGLQIIDVSDANNPFISDFLDLPGYVYGIAISEDIAYVANDDSGIQVLDIRMPTKPYKVATIQTDHRAIGLSVVDDKLYIVGDQYLSVLPVANIEIETYTDKTIQLNIAPQTLPGLYHLNVYNPQNSVISKNSILVPSGVAGEHHYLSGNSDHVIIPLTIEEINPDLPIQDYTITASSLNQKLISNDNISLTITESKTILLITPTTNQFGTTIIEIAITTNGIDYQYKHFSVSVQFADIEISSVTPSQGISGSPLNLTVTGKGFDTNSKVIMLPDNHSAIEIYNKLSNAWGVEVVNHIAYVSDGREGLKIIDVNNPFHPILVGEVDTPDFANSVAVTENTVYLADEDSGLHIIDTSDLFNPIIIDTVNLTYNDAQDVKVSGDNIYIANGNHGLEIIDRLNFSQSSVSVNTPDFAHGVALIDNIAFVSDDDSGIQIIDIQDISAPYITDIFDLPGKVYDVAISGDIAYVANGDNGIQVLDISMPQKPYRLATIQTTIRAIDVCVVGNKLYFVGDQYLYVLPITNIKIENCSDTTMTLKTSSQTVSGQYHLKVCNPEICVAESYLVLPPFNVSEVSAALSGNSAPMSIPFDISGTSSDVSIQDYTITAYSLNQRLFSTDNISLTITEDQTYIQITPTTNQFGTGIIELRITDGKVYQVERFTFSVQFLDIEITSVKPTQGLLGETLKITATGKGFDHNTKVFIIPDGNSAIKIFDKLSNAYGIEVVNNLAYIADGEEGLKIIDVKNPFYPVLIGSVDTPDFARGIAVNDNTVYIADDESGLQIIDASDLSNPIIKGAVEFNDDVADVKIDVNKLFIANGGSGLQIIDRLNPSQSLGSVDTPDYANGVAIAGDIVYVADDDAGIQIISVSDISQPYITDNFDMPNDNRKIIISDDIAYVLNYWERNINILDISTRTKPYQLATISPEHYVNAIAVEDNKLYIAGGPYLSMLSVANIKIENSTNSAIKLETSPITVSGQYHLLISNPENSDSCEYTILSPVLVSGVSASLSGNSSPLSIPFNMTGINAGDSIENYAITANSLNQKLISNNNITLTRTQSQHILTITPTPDQFGTAIIELRITNGKVYQVERFSIPVHFSDIVISSVTPSQGLLGEPLELTITGKGFDYNSSVIMVPGDNSEVVVFNELYDACDVEVVKNIAYVADYREGLKIIDVNNPFHPVLIGILDTPGYAYGVAVTGYTVYVADGHSGLHVIDASDPYNPIHQYTIDLDLYINNVNVSGNIAYLSNGSSGIQIIDIVNPSQSLGAVIINDYAYGVAVVSNILYVAEKSGLQIIDVKDVSKPLITNFINMTDYVYDIAVSGDMAYVAKGTDGIQILNISNPIKPVKLATIETDHRARGIDIVNDKLFIVGRDYLSILSVANIEIEDKTASSLQLNISPVVLPGHYYIKVSNPENRDTAVFSILPPFIVSEVSASLSGNSSLVSIPFEITGINADVSIKDYTITAKSLSQDLISNDNISLTITDSQQIIQITPTKNQFGSAPIELIITNGTAYQIEPLTVSVQFADIEILSIEPSQGIFNNASNFTVTGKGFDNHTKVIMLPDDNSAIEIFNELDDAWGIEVVNNLAYVADGKDGLKIFDVNNPFHPIMIGSIDTPDFAYGVAVTGYTVYVADDDSGLQVIDASDPSHPIITGSVDLNNDVYGVKVSGDYAYIANGSYGLIIINLLNPSEPLGSVDTPGYAYGIALVGTTVYIADRSSDLQIIDVSDYRNPYITNFFDIPGYVYDVTISGNIAYVANNDSDLQVLDISNPQNTFLLSTIKTNHPARGLSVVNDKLFIVGQQYLSVLPLANIEIKDYSNTKMNLKINPMILSGQYQLKVYNPESNDAAEYSIFFPFKLIFPEISYTIPGNSGIISIPFDITEINADMKIQDYTITAYSLNQNLIAHNNISLSMTESQKLLLITPSPNQFGTTTIIFLLSNGIVCQIEPLTITVQFPDIEISSVTPSQSTWGETLALTLTGKGFDNDTKVIMIPDDNSAIEIFNELDDAWGIEVVNNLAYVADGKDGLKIFDVNNPFHPIMIGAIDTPDFAYGVAVTGYTVYVADDDSGLQVIDASDPSHPIITGSVDLNNDLYGVKVSGDYAYIANGSYGLIIMNLLNPSEPLGSADTPGYAYGIALVGTTVYIADRSSDLQIIDISDYRNPYIANFFDIPGYVYDVTISENIAYVANKEKGIQVLDISNITKPNKLATINTEHYARGIAFADDILYIVGENYLTALPVPSIEIDNFTDTSLKLNVTPQVMAGQYHLKAYNLQSFDMAEYSIRPFIVSEVSTCLSGNSASALIPFNITRTSSDITIQDYTITTCSLNQKLISNDNISLIITESQPILEITPTANQFGTAIIELRITNGNVYQVERFTISVQFSEIEISTITPSQSILGEPFKLTVTGKGFDDNSKVIMLPDDNSIIKIFNEFSNAWDVEVVDNIAYVADGYAGLKIIDVKNPFHPIMIGAIDTPDFASGVTVTGYTVYVADVSSGLQIIDASDLSDPKITDTVHFNSEVRGIKVSGDIAYLANGSAGLQIMNIHNPSQLLGVADTPDWAYDIAVNGNTVYIADNDSGLQIIDVSDANNPFISDFLDLPYDVYGIAISEDIAYVANDDSSIQVLDIRIPTKPYKVATIQTDHPARGLSVVDDKLYIVGDQYLSVLPAANIEIEAYTNNLMKLKSSPLTFSGDYHLKVCNPESSDTVDYSVLPPFLVSEVSAALSGNSAIMSIPFDITKIYSDISIQDYTITACSLNQYLISNNDITIKTTELQNILQVKPITNQFGTAIILLSITNGKVYQSERFTIVVDFSDIEILSVVPSQSILGEPVELTITGKGFDSNTKVILVPEDNSAINIYNDLSYAFDIKVVNNLAYVADGNAGLKILDVKNTLQPILIGSINTPGYAYGVDVADNTVYIPDGNSGMQIIDASDPSHPTITDTVDLNKDVRSVKVVGYIAYIAYGSSGGGSISWKDVDTGPSVHSSRMSTLSTHPLNTTYADFYSGLQIMDIRNPSQLIGIVDISASPNGIAIIDNIVYIVDIYSGLQIIDVSDVRNPYITDFYDLPYNVYDVTISENLAYVANDESGIHILDISNPIKPYYLTTIKTDHPARGVTVDENLLYIVGKKYLSVLPVTDIEINAYTDTTLNLNIASPVLPGEYQLKIFNPASSSNAEFYVLPPVIVSEITESLPVNSGPVSIPFNIEKTYSDASIIDYTITANSSNQSLISNDNISLTITESQQILNITPTNNQFGITTIELIINNGVAYHIKPFTISVHFADIEIISLTPSQGILGEASELTVTGKGFDNNFRAVMVPDEKSAIDHYFYEFSYARDIEVVNNMAFIADTLGGLKIVDVTNPFHPILLESVDAYDSYLVGVSVTGDTIYVADNYSWLKTVDITDIANPTIRYIGDFDDINNVKVSGNIAYIAKGSSGLLIIDIRYPSETLSTINTPGYVYDIEVIGSILYVADGSSGIQIIDISNVRKPSIIDSLDMSGRVYDIAISGDIAYVANGSNGIQILDISNPAKLYKLATIKTDHFARSIAVAEDKLYIVGNHYLSILAVANIEFKDYTDTSLRLKVSPLTLSGQYHLKLLNSENTATAAFSIFPPFVASEVTPSLPGNSGPVPITFNVESINSDEPIKDYTISAWSLNQRLISNDNISLTITESQQILQITPTFNQYGTAPIILSNGTGYQIGRFNISVQFADIKISSVTPSQAFAGEALELTVTGKGFDHNSKIMMLPDDNAVEIYNALNNAWGVEVVNNLAYVADGETGLKIIDVNNPFHPVLIGAVDTPDFAYGVAVTGNTIYVADNYAGIQIIDATDLANPTIKDTIDINYSSVRDINITKNIAYVANGSSGLQIINMQDFSEIIGVVDTPDYAYGVAENGSIVYIADDDSGIQIIDVTDVNMPYVIDFLDMPYNVYGITLSENIAYAANNDSDVQVLDISSSANPYRVAKIKTEHPARGVAVYEGNVYIVGENTLSVLSVANVETEYYTDTSFKLKISPRTLSGQYHLKVCNPENNDTAEFSVLSPFLVSEVSESLSGNSLPVSIPFDITEINSDVSIQDYSITAWSLNNKLISNDNISLTLTESPKIIQITPTTNRFGSAIIELRITNGKNFQVKQFSISVNYTDIEISSVTPSQGMLGESLDLTVTGKSFDHNSNVIMIPYDNSAIEVFNKLSNAWNIEIDNNLLYVADGKEGIKVIDVTDPFYPVLKWTIDVPNFAYGVSVADNTVYVVDSHSCLQIINVSDLSNPIVTDTFVLKEYTWNSVHDIRISDHFAYIAQGSSGLKIIDILNYSQPLGAIDIPGWASGVAVTDSIIFITDGESGIQIIDISDPNKPFITDNFILPVSFYNTLGITLSDDLAYVADERGIHILNISTPTKPYKLATVKTVHHARGVAVFDDKLFIAGDQHLSVLPLANVIIENYTDTTLKLKIPPVALSGQYYLKVCNPESYDSIEFPIEPPFLVSEISASLTGNSGPITIPLNIKGRTPEVSIQDYTMTARSLNQTLFSNDNISLSVTKSEQILQITPTTNQFGEAIIELIITDGINYQIERHPVSVQFSDIDILSVMPSQGLLGESLEVTVTGKGFDHNSKVFMIPGDNSSVEILNDLSYAWGIEVVNNIAYVADGWDGLKIIDVTNPFHPIQTGRVNTTYAYGVAVSANTVYLAYSYSYSVYGEEDSKSGIQIIDVTDLFNPLMTGSITLINNVRDIHVLDSIAYIIHEHKGLQIIDMLNPAQTLGTVDIFGNNYGLGVAVRTIYVANEYSGIQIIDVSDSNNPKTVDYFDIPDLVYDVSVSDDIAYIANNDRGIQVLDIHNSTKPYKIATIKTNHPVRGITVDNDQLYFVGDRYLSTMQVANITIEDYTDTQLTLKIPTLNLTGQYNLKVFNPISSDTCELSILPPFIVSDISASLSGNSAPVSIPLEITGINSDVSIQDYTITACSLDQNIISDDNVSLTITESQQIMQLTPTINQFGTTTIKLEISNGIAYQVKPFTVSVQFSDIEILSVTPTQGILGETSKLTVTGKGFDHHSKVFMRPDDDTAIKVFNELSNASGVEVVNNLAYIADGWSGLKIIDVSNPFHTVLIKAFDTPGSAHDVAVKGDTVYVADGDSGLLIIDASDLSNPIITDAVQLNNSVKDIHILNNIAYIANGSPGLDIIDIRNPSQILGFFDTPHSAYGVSVAGNIVYVVCNDYDILIIDISDVSKPYIDDIFDIRVRGDDVAISGDIAYIANGYYAIQVLDISKPAKPYELDIINTNHSTEGIALADDKLYFVGGHYLSVLPVANVEILNYTDTTLKLNISSNTLSNKYNLMVYNPQTSDATEYTVLNFLVSEFLALSGNSGPVSLPFDIKAISPNISIKDYTITARSLNQTLISDNNLSIAISESQQIFHITPTTNQFGTAIIELKISNGKVYQVEHITISVNFADIEILSVTPSQGLLGEALKLTVTGKSLDSNSRVIMVPDDNSVIEIFNDLSDAQDVEVVNNLAYVADGKAGLKIIDINNLFHPVLIGELDTPGFARGIALKGNIVYIADENSGLHLIDKSDLSNLIISDTIEFNDDYVLDIEVSDNIAYIANRFKLRIIDIRNSSQLLSFVNLPNYASSVGVIDNNVYVVDNSGIQIIDVNDVSNPYLADHYDVNYDIYDATISGDIAYASNDYWRSGRIHIFDLSKPTTPENLSIINIDHGTRGITVVDDKLYVVGDQSLSVLPVPTIGIEKSSDTLLTLNLSPLTVSGQYQLKVCNPEKFDTAEYSILPPFLVSEISTSLSGNTAPVTKIFDIEGITSDVTIDDYTITVNSLNQKLISNDNISLTITESQKILQITPTANQFGTAIMELRITNGKYYQVERFTITVQFSDIEISYVTPSQVFLGGALELTVTGKYFDQNSKGIILPGDNSNDSDYYYGYHYGWGGWGYNDSNKVITYKNNDIEIFNELCDAQDLEVVNHLAYVADGEAGLKIIDINNLFHAVQVGSVETPSVANGVAVKGDTVYVANLQSGLLIIDASDLSNPIITGTVKLNDYTTDVKVQNNIGYIVDRYSVLQIIDMSNPLQVIGSFNTDGYINGFSVADSTVYAASSKGIQIIDVRDVLNTYTTTLFDMNGHDISISGDIAYITNDDSGIKVLDISNSTEPYKLGKIKTDHTARGTTIVDNKIYIVGEQYLSVLQVANIDIENYTDTTLTLNISPLNLSGQYHIKVYNPENNDSKELSIRPHFLVPEISTTIAGNSNPVTISLDIERINSDVSIQDYTITAFSFNPALISNNNISLTISESQQILQITPTINQFGTAQLELRITNGKFYQAERFTITVQFADLEIASVTPTQGILGEPLELNISGKGFDNSTKVTMVPIDNSSIEIYNALNSACGIEVVNNLAYIADGSAGLKILDIKNPFQPILRVCVDTPDSARGVAVIGSTVYVADNNSGLQIIDASDLSNPIITDTIRFDNYVSDIEISDNIAYIANGSSGLQIINLNNPSLSLGIADTPYYASGIAVAGSTVYVADVRSGIQIIDVSDIYNPYLTDFYDVYIESRSYFTSSYEISDDVIDVSLSGHIAYVVYNDYFAYGIQVLDISNPTKPYKLTTVKTNYRARGVTVADEKIYIVGDQYLSVLPVVKNFAIEDFTKINLKLPASSFVQEYNLIIANPQYSKSQPITFEPPFMIGKIPNQVIYPSIEKATFALTITPTLSETEVRNYTVIGFSGNPSMLPDDHITIEGEGLNRAIHIKPPNHQYGTLPINIVINNGYASIKESFKLTVKYPQLSYNYLPGDISETVTPSTFIEKDGYRYEVNTYDHCILKKDQNNDIIAQWGQQGTGNGSFNQPTGIAIDEDGFIYVVDKGNNRVQVFTSYGEFITSFGEFGAGKLNSPEYIHIAENSDIYISEKDNERTKIFQQADYTEGITKAIIVVGGGSTEANAILKASRNCGDLAYNALTYQGLDPKMIYYISSESDNKKVNDNATIDNIKIAITQWAKGETATTETSITADSLIVYLVDHGGDGIFRVNENEILSATVLKGWLDEIQNIIPGKLFVIYEACYSGSFIPLLTNKDLNRERIVITSALRDETAELANNGAISFSNYFWSAIFNGNDVRTAFKTAQRVSEFKINNESVIKNTPQISTNKIEQSIMDDAVDSLQNVYIGNGVQNSVIPVIWDISPKQYIANTETSTITACVSLPNDKISEVWAHIVPKSQSQFDSAINIEEKISMTYNESKKVYEGIFEPASTDQNETYFVAVYARDNNGLVSNPELTLITVNDPQKRCAILVIGKDLTNKFNESHYNIKDKAIRSLKAKKYSNEDIYLVEENSRYLPSENGLATAISDCIAITPKDILLYMIGRGNGTYFEFNETQITQEQFTSIITKIQNVNIPVTIVYDGPYAYNYLSTIKDYNNCILLSSSQSQYAYFEMEGYLSFSWHFWNMVANGSRLKDIYISTFGVLYTAFKAEQLPNLIDKGNRASSYIIGYDYGIESDIPNIESVSPEQTLFCNNSADILAHNISSLNKIDKVVALIFTPELPHQLTSGPEIVPMQPVMGTNDYMTTYTDFTFAGEYYISICAFDTLGNMSYPLTTTVIQKVGKNSVLSVLEVLTGVADNHPLSPVLDLFNDDRKIGLGEAIYFMQCME